MQIEITATLKSIPSIKFKETHLKHLFLFSSCSHFHFHFHYRWMLELLETKELVRQDRPHVKLVTTS